MALQVVSNLDFKLNHINAQNEFIKLQSNDSVDPYNLKLQLNDGLDVIIQTQ